MLEFINKFLSTEHICLVLSLECFVPYIECSKGFEDGAWCPLISVAKMTCYRGTNLEKKNAEAITIGAPTFGDCFTAYSPVIFSKVIIAVHSRIQMHLLYLTESYRALVCSCC